MYAGLADARGLLACVPYLTRLGVHHLSPSGGTFPALLTVLRYAQCIVVKGLLLSASVTVPELWVWYRSQLI